MIFLTSAISVVILLGVILLSKKITIFSEDISVDPRKIHTSRVPRVGGLLFFPIMILPFYNEFNQYSAIIITASLLLTIGLYEDFKKNTSSYIRFLLIVGFVCLFVIQENFVINEFSNEILNYANQFPFFSILFVILGLLFFINGFNFIDGANGLMLGTALIILLNYLFFTYSVSEYLFKFNLNIFVCTLILFLTNFPFGKIFTGDGGSYFLGFIIGCLSILMVKENILTAPHIACLIFYPIVEIFITFWRRVFINKTNPFKPDEFHLHILLFKKISSYEKLKKINQDYRNSLTSFIILMFIIISSLPLYSLINHINLLFIFFLYCIIYLFIFIQLYKERNNLNKGVY